MSIRHVYESQAARIAPVAHVILGLLLIAPRSLYDLIKDFEAGVGLFYSASAGSIKRALDGLLREGRIEVASTERSGRGRKTYRVTDSGREEFRSWMTGDVTGTDLETAALARLHFLGLLEAGERPLVLRRIQARYAADLARLTALEEELSTAEVPPEFHDIAAYQQATLDYGIATLRFALDWFQRIPGSAEPAEQARENPRD
nr:PadR family transcriptional regulator [Sediminivirga luteola]